VHGGAEDLMLHSPQLVVAEHRFDRYRCGPRHENAIELLLSRDSIGVNREALIADHLQVAPKAGRDKDLRGSLSVRLIRPYPL
jgi:hypothetical protein